MNKDPKQDLEYQNVALNEESSPQKEKKPE